MSPVLSAEPRPPQPDVPASPVGPALQAIQAELRDIHPGAPLEEAPDPRLAAWGGLLLALLALWLAAILARTLWRQRRWAHQLLWQGEDLVPRLHTALREAALARWPEAGPLQGEAWLAWLDRKGGSDFSQFAGQWPHWLYGAAQPNEAERARLRRAYLRWGRRCVATPRLTRMRRPVGGNR